MPTRCRRTPHENDPAKAAPPPLLLRGEEVACALDISLAGVYHLSETGLIPPARKFGVRARWLLSDLQTMLADLPVRVRKQRPEPTMPFAKPKPKQPTPKGGSKE